MSPAGAIVGMDDSVFDLQTEIIFAGNEGVKMNKLKVDKYAFGIVIDFI